MTTENVLAWVLFPVNLVKAIGAVVWWLIAAMLAADDDE